MDKTPIQLLIQFMEENWTEDEIKKDNWLSSFWGELQWALPKEKEFAGNCFERGFNYGVQASHHPNKQQLINQLYPEK